MTSKNLLDPELAIGLEAFPPFAGLSAETLPQMRAMIAELGAAQIAQIPREGVIYEDRRIAGARGAPDVRMAIYRPETQSGPLPVCLHMHGGGMVMGSPEIRHASSIAMAASYPCIIASVDYRLAPEWAFPAAVEDCYAGAAWVVAHAGELGVDPSRVAVGGDSSGGNLAAAVTLMAKERGGPAFVHQLLVYPNTDAAADTDSMRDVVDEHFFNKNAIAWYWSMYLASPGDGLNPLASPLRAPDLSGLPPATVITAELDPLRDESEQYGEALAKAGVAAEIIRYDGMIHGFFTMVGILDTAREAVATAADRLSRAFAPSA